MFFYSRCCNNDQDIEILKEASQMERLTIRDRMLMYAENGETSIKLNLFKKQIELLIEDGYTVQRIGSTPYDFGQSVCRIDWKNATKGTQAYELLKKAAEVKPELLQQDGESGTPLPPPYSVGGDWT